MGFEIQSWGEKCIKGKVQLEGLLVKGNWTWYLERLALRIHGWCATEVMRWNGGGLALGNRTWYTKVAALRIHRWCAKEVMGWIGDGLALGKWTPCIEQLALCAIAVGVQAE